MNGPVDYINYEHIIKHIEFVVGVLIVVSVTIC